MKTKTFGDGIFRVQPATKKMVQDGIATKLGELFVWRDTPDGVLADPLSSVPEMTLQTGEIIADLTDEQLKEFKSWCAKIETENQANSQPEL